MSMRFLCVLAILALAFMPMNGCFAHRHTVGDGPNGDGPGFEHAHITLYALWGLIPINSKRADMIVTGDGNYVIETKMDGINFLINFFGSVVTIVSDTMYIRE